MGHIHEARSQEERGQHTVTSPRTHGPVPCDQGLGEKGLHPIFAQSWVLNIIVNFLC
jgi:hypothetical protein